MKSPANKLLEILWGASLTQRAAWLEEDVLLLLRQIVPFPLYAGFNPAEFPPTPVGHPAWSSS